MYCLHMILKKRSLNWLWRKEQSDTTLNHLPCFHFASYGLLLPLHLDVQLLFFLKLLLCYIDSFCPSQRPCLIWDVICSINSRSCFLLLSIFFMSLSSWQRPCTGRLDWTRRRWPKQCAGAQRRICWVLRRVTRTSSLRFTTLLPVVTTRWASQKVWLSKRDEWLCNKLCLVSLFTSTVSYPPNDKPRCIGSVNLNVTQDKILIPGINKARECFYNHYW